MTKIIRESFLPCKTSCFLLTFDLPIVATSASRLTYFLTTILGVVGASGIILLFSLGLMFSIKHCYVRMKKGKDPEKKKYYFQSPFKLCLSPLFFSCPISVFTFRVPFSLSLALSPSPLIFEISFSMSNVIKYYVVLTEYKFQYSVIHLHVHQLSVLMLPDNDTLINTLTISLKPVYHWSLLT